MQSPGRCRGRPGEPSRWLAQEARRHTRVPSLHELGCQFELLACECFLHPKQPPLLLSLPGEPGLSRSPPSPPRKQWGSISAGHAGTAPQQHVPSPLTEITLEDVGSCCHQDTLKPGCSNRVFFFLIFLFPCACVCLAACSCQERRVLILVRWFTQRVSGLFCFYKDPR